jgi:hypothetical protein
VTADPDGGSLAETSDAGPGATPDGSIPAPAGFRVGPEAASALPAASGAFADAAVLRCPLGAVIVGLDVGMPPATSNVAPFTASRHRLRCATVDGQGDLSPPFTVEPGGAASWPFESSPLSDYVWSPVACPTGQVATRLVGSFDRRETTQLVTLGVRCQPLATVLDGGAVTSGAKSAPEMLGATSSGPETLDVPCANGGALGGIAYGSASTKPKDLVLRGLCRDVLRAQLPGGAPWSPASPVKLGAATTTATITTNGELPSVPDTIKVVRDCPSGQVVTAVDGGRSTSLAGAPLVDVQVTCRPLGPDGAVGSQTTNVGTTTARLQSACLLGQAVAGITFAGGELSVLGKKYFDAEDLSVSCRVPVPGDARSSAPIPSWVPGTRSDQTPLERAVACPTGSVMAGMDLFAPLDQGERRLTGLALRCRPLER